MRPTHELLRWIETLPRELQSHIKRVRLEAMALAELYDLNKDQVALAANSHDVARAMTDKELLRRAQSFGLRINPVEMVTPILLHGPVGAELLKREMGITNNEVIEATRVHTNAKPEMSTLAQVIFLADKLDPAKKQRYPFIDEIREISRRDLSTAVLSFLNQNIVDFTQRGNLVHPDMLEARNHFLIHLQHTAQPNQN